MNKLKRSEDKFILLFENSPVGMAMIDHHTGKFLEVNDALLNYVGYTKDELMKMSFWDITPRKYDSQEQAQIEELNQKGQFGPNEKEYIRKDGSRLPIRLSGFKMTDVDEREVVWGVIEDITIEKSLKAERRKLKKLSTTDHLTGLFNRQKLEAVMEAEINLNDHSSPPFSVILLDMDHFKHVNDTYGHAVGDDVLVSAAQTLKHYTRKADIVGRWGGEEFLIVCPETDSEEAEVLADKVRQAIEKTACKTIIENISASFGLTQLLGSDDMRSLLSRVDKALYQAKKQGRNRIICL